LAEIGRGDEQADQFLALRHCVTVRLAAPALALL
jgi:hypothetical protein